MAIQEVLSESSGNESEETRFYSTQDSEATALYVTQIKSLIDKGDRKRTLK